MTVLTFSVPDISCEHCKLALEAAIGPIPAVRSAVVSVEQRVVTVDSDAPEQFIRAAIEDSGYTVQGPAHRPL
jgi:copper chaperone